MIQYTQKKNMTIYLHVVNKILKTKNKNNKRTRHFQFSYMGSSGRRQIEPRKKNIPVNSFQTKKKEKNLIDILHTFI